MGLWFHLTNFKSTDWFHLQHTAWSKCLRPLCYFAFFSNIIQQFSLQISLLTATSMKSIWYILFLLSWRCTGAGTDSTSLYKTLWTILDQMCWLNTSFTRKDYAWEQAELLNKAVSMFNVTDIAYIQIGT